jgi:hypothetical protein
MMKSLCQKDPQWADDKIGASSLHVGAYGCALTCVADLSGAWNAANQVFPGQIAAHADWFTKPGDNPGEGLIKWGSLEVHGLRFEGRVRAWHQTAVLAASLDPNRAAMIEVTFPGAATHWVVAVRWVPVLGWRVADPLTGTYRWLPKDWRPIGYALFSRV